MIKVCVPATSANCCVGFDCMGIALDWWSTFTFDVAHTTWVSGCDPCGCFNSSAGDYLF